MTVVLDVVFLLVFFAIWTVVSYVLVEVGWTVLLVVYLWALRVRSRLSERSRS